MKQMDIGTVGMWFVLDAMTALIPYWGFFASVKVNSRGLAIISKHVWPFHSIPWPC